MIDLAASSRLLKALGDETRLRILNLLVREELSGTDLIDILNMGQSRISTHLSLLREVGLVEDRRAGRRTFYKAGRGPQRELLDRVLRDSAAASEFATDLAELESLKVQRQRDARSYFDRVAASFGEQILPGRTWEGLARALLALAPGGRYVDLGIGDGLLTMMLAEVADQVTAVDLSPEMLSKLEQRARREGLDNITTVEGEIDAPPLPDRSHDVCVLSQALHHATDPAGALGEAARILVPSGRLLVIELLAHTEDWVRERYHHRHLGFTEAELERLLTGAGFEAVRVQRAARDPQPPHFITLIGTGTRSAPRAARRGRQRLEKGASR